MRLRKIRVLVGALMAEILGIVLLLMFVVPLAIALEPPSLQAGERLARQMILWAAPLSALASCFLAGWWVARRLALDQVRHGVITGLGAAALDVGWLLLLNAPFQAVFVLAEIVRVGGGAAGGWLASRWPARSTRVDDKARYSRPSAAAPSGSG